MNPTAKRRRTSHGLLDADHTRRGALSARRGRETFLGYPSGMGAHRQDPPPPWVIDHRSSIVPPDLEHVLPRGWTLARDVPPIVDIPRPGATAGTIHALPPSSIVVSVGIRCGRGPGGLLRDREVETGDGGGAAVSDEERVRGCVGCGCPEEVCLFGRGGGTVLVVLVRVGGRHVR